MSKEAYLQGSYLFSFSTLENLANKDFNAYLFSSGKGALAPFVNEAAPSAAILAATQLSVFTRLSILRDLSFYLFINVNVKLKFVLFAFALQPLHVVLSAGSPFLKPAPKYPFLK